LHRPVAARLTAGCRIKPAPSQIQESDFAPGSTGSIILARIAIYFIAIGPLYSGAVWEFPNPGFSAQAGFHHPADRGCNPIIFIAYERDNQLDSVWSGC